MGNHEEWVSKHVEKYPELSGHMDWAANLRLEDRGISCVRRDDTWTHRGVTFLHGWHCNIYHAKKTLERVGGTCLYGHVHKEQVHTAEQSRNGVMVARSTGCLCAPEADFLHGPTAHTNGLGFVEYREDGGFQASLISIVDGAMTFGGETWRG